VKTLHAIARTANCLTLFFYVGIFKTIINTNQNFALNIFDQKNLISNLVAVIYYFQVEQRNFKHF